MSLQLPTKLTPAQFSEYWEKLSPEKRDELWRLTQASGGAALEAKGWRHWYAAMFGQELVDSLDGEGESHHSEAIEWHWESRMAFLRGKRPEYFAYFPIWARGNLKTTTLRALIICDACLSTTAGVGGYALIPGGTKKKVRGTAISIQSSLSLPTIKKYYPSLSKVKRNTQGSSQGWTADFLNTDAGYVFHFIGLEEGVAGANVNDIRPTLIAPDDIDDREDSPVISEQRFQTFTRAVLPTRQANTLVYFAQNLISRYSVMYRIQNQQERVLTNRKPTVPVPAVRGLVTETRTVGGIVKDVPVAGKTTWRGWDMQRVGDEIDTYGLKAFLRECQHEVEQDSEGLVLKNWDDSVHVISYSQFAAVYGTRQMPFSWSKYVFNDWARTKTKFHANVSGVLTVSAQNSALPGCVFVFHPMSFNAGSAPEDVAERLLTVISPYVEVNGRKVQWKELVKSTLQKTGLEDLIGDVTELIRKQRSILADVIPKLVRPLIRAQNYLIFRGSHDQNGTGQRGKDTGALEVFRTVFGLPFHGINPGADGGVDRINMLQKVDYSVEHPFKSDHMGWSNFFLVVDDDQSDSNVIKRPVPFNDALTPNDVHDAELFRYQMREWRYRDPHLTIQGELEGQLLKLNDDYGNGLMMLFYDNAVKAASLTKDETREERLKMSGLGLERYDELQSQGVNPSGLVAARNIRIYEMEKQSYNNYAGPGMAKARANRRG